MIDPEKLAIKLLNSDKINHCWKKDFKKDLDVNHKWDLSNSQSVRLEVKSTKYIKRFNFNSISPNVKEQKKQIILKILVYNNKIKKYKFVKFIHGKWKDISKNILKNKISP